MIAHWIIFSLIIPLVPFSLAYVFVKFGKTDEWSEKEKRVVGMTVVKNTMYFWLLDFFYMSCFTGWFFGKNIFGVLTILFVFVNLTNAFLAKSRISKWTLLLDFLVGMGLSAYLIYIIPIETLQTVVLTIVAATYGGLLTLIGVAWTIKDNSEKMRQERKLSIKPYLDVSYKCFTDIIELPTKDILTIELGKVIVVHPKISDDINDLFILRSRVFGDVERLSASVYKLELERFISTHMMLYTEIENCGSGNAIDVKLKFNDNEIASLCITTSTTKKILFVFKDELLGEEKGETTKIKLSFEYTDVASLGKYKQVESFNFGRDSTDKLYVSQTQEDLLTSPVEIQ